jgi:hypothetical protein
MFCGPKGARLRCLPFNYRIWLRDLSRRQRPSYYADRNYTLHGYIDGARVTSRMAVAGMSVIGPLRHLARHNEMSAVEVTAEVVQTSRDVAV